MKILMLTPSRSEQCGIWTYSNYLIPHLADLGVTTELTRDFEHFQKVVGNYDLVHVQDEYGIVPDGLLYFFRDKNIPYVITMHTLWEKKREHHDAFREPQCKAIICHSQDQVKALLRTHPELQEKVHLIPHGSFETKLDDHVYTGGRVKIGSFGFSSFPKRFVETFQQLKKTSLDFEYRLLSSWQKDNYNAIEYGNLLSKLKIDEDREAEHEKREPRFYLNNQFLPESVILEKLKTCDILVSFVTPIIAPSVSGSSRFLMQAGRPVIVSDIYHYSDVPDDVFVKIHPSLPEKDIEWAVQTVIDDYDGYVARIAEYTKKTSWANVAKLHVELYSKCHSIEPINIPSPI